MEKRKTSIELMRFLSAVMVVLIHIRQKIYPDNGIAGSLLTLTVALAFAAAVMVVREIHFTISFIG